MKIIFPESDNRYIVEAAEQLRQSSLCDPILRNSTLEEACKSVTSGEADALIAGIDYSSRDVILAARDFLGVEAPVFSEKNLFSSLFVAKFPDGRTLILSDGATCKHPTVEQLADIIRLTSAAAAKILDDEPRVALLSFSTFGSGGKDATMDLLREAKQLYLLKFPEAKVDGEMQLDAAINPRIGAKKAPNSEVAGRANVLIVPDINAGNILYKSFEQLAGAQVAGPILLGFKYPVSDLSRGSTAEDVVFTAECLARLA
ncbi:phosphate acetyltransferase [Candidatus Saccharibacteria bacterium]|nr:phosphate acetyltransferase [Candidatus Saccharibacteria bacterium]